MKRQGGAILTALCAFVAGSLLLNCAQLARALPYPMSDAKVLGLVNTIDQMEIDAAEFAQQKAGSPDVKAFASRLAREHTTAIQERHLLAEKMNVEPTNPQFALALKEEYGETHYLLERSSGQDFDEAYLANDILIQQQLSDLLRDIQESLDNPTLRRHVRSCCQYVRTHLSAARELFAQR